MTRKTKTKTKADNPDKVDSKIELSHKVADLTGIAEVDWTKLSVKDLETLAKIFSDPTGFVANLTLHRTERRFEKRMEQGTELMDRLRKKVRERPVAGALLKYLSGDDEEKKD
jgi:hypothetical protein